MTIVDLLRRHGHNCTRRVLPSGLLVFDDALPAGSTPAGMPLKQHTFHGGEPPQEQDTGYTSPWWLESGSLDRERAAMAEHFPRFMLVEGTADLPPAWAGAVRARRAEFQIMVMHRRDHGLPTVVPVSPKARRRWVGRRLIGAPHLYTSGDLCVAAAEDWDPEIDTVATVVGWAAHWHACYVEWFFTGKWPTEGYRADAA